MGWWLSTDSLQLGDTGVYDVGRHVDPGTGALVSSDHTQLVATGVGLQSICAGVGMGIAVLLLLFAAIKTMIQRKGVHLLQAFQGLAVDAVVCAVGIAVIDGMLVAADQLTKTILGIAFTGDTGAQIAEQIAGVLVSNSWNPTTTLVLCLLVLLATVTQLAMMFVRQAAIPIQALLLPIAGAGQLGGPRAREWLPRLYTSIITVIVYKPLAAFLIAVGFFELSNGAGVLDWVRGLVTMLMATFALQALMGLFAPFGVAMAGATAGGGFGQAMLQAAGSLSMLGAGRGSGDGGRGGAAAAGVSAVQHAQQMARTGPAAGGAGGAGETGTSGWTGSGEAGPGRGEEIAAAGVGAGAASGPALASRSPAARTLPSSPAAQPVSARPASSAAAPAPTAPAPAPAPATGPSAARWTQHARRSSGGPPPPSWPGAPEQ